MSCCCCCDDSACFVWYELGSADARAAQAFYAALIGWGSATWGGDPGGYPMFTVDGAAVGGFHQLSPEAVAGGCPNAWLAYVGVEDVDATLARAVALGASVHVPARDLPGIGRMAVFQDPQGAMLALFSAEDDCGPEGPEMTTLGAIGWHELSTTDLEAAWTFYRELFGWQVARDMDMGPEYGTYRIFQSRGDTRGGVFAAPHGAPVGWLLYFRVADMQAALARAETLGARLLHGPIPVPGGEQVAQFVDPQGAAFALLAPGE